MTDTRPHRDMAGEMPITLTPSVVGAFGSTLLGDTPWKALGLDTYDGSGTLGPGVTALIDAVSPKVGGDTPWRTVLGLDTNEGPNVSDVIGNLGLKPGDTSWAKAFGLDTYDGPGVSALADMGRGTLGSGVTALIDAVSPKLGDTPWAKMFGLDTYDGPNMSALISTLGPKLGDGTTWKTALGPDTYDGPGATAWTKAFSLDTLGLKHGDTSWAKAFGLDTYRPSISEVILGTKPGDTSRANAFGLDGYGGSISSFVDGAALHTIEDRIGAPWIKHLAGGGAYGPLLDGDDLSPTSLLEEVPFGLETAELSVGALPVETDPLTSVQGGTDLRETTWSWDALDSAAVLVSVIFMPMALLFHLQGLDWALSPVEFVAALFLALILRDRR